MFNLIFNDSPLPPPPATGSDPVSDLWVDFTLLFISIFGN